LLSLKIPSKRHHTIYFGRTIGQLVNSDVSLTFEKQRAHDCIQNGILLGGGVLLVFGANGITLPLIIQGLKTLGDNVVNWDTVNSDDINIF
jgi:hypothetical protein